jgi:hypothetical protein
MASAVLRRWLTVAALLPILALLPSAGPEPGSTRCNGCHPGT